jgi:centractin
MNAEEAVTEGDAGSSLLLNQPVVIDNGTSTLKAGFAGSSKPKVRVFGFVGG